jgi:hypothetical protein
MLVVAGTLLAVASWITLSIADFNAWWIMAASNEPSRELPWFEYVQMKMSQRDFWRFFHWQGLVGATLPVPALVLFSGSRTMQFAGFVVIAGFFALNIFQLLSFEGGDFKGCDGCFSLFILHWLFGIVAVLSSLLYCGWRVVTKYLERRPRHETGL